MRSLIVAFFLTFKSIIRGNIYVSMLTIAILTLITLNLLFVPGLLHGITNSANDRLVNTYSGDIIIESTRDNALIRKVDQLSNMIESMDGVVGVTYRNAIGASLTYEDEYVNCVVRGVPPEREKKVFQIADAIFEGSYLKTGEFNKIILGIQLAGCDRPEIELYTSSLKKIHAGDTISVSFTNGVIKQYEVKGIFHTELIRTDLQAFITDREFRAITNLGRNQAASIHVKTKSDADAARIIEQIDYLWDDIRFQTWQDMAGIVRSMTDSFTMINGILTVVNLLIVGTTIFIVTYVDLVNKRRQIGIERAIGITASSIIMSYIFRAIFFAIIGVIASWLIYIYIAIPLEERYPFQFPFGPIKLYVDLNMLLSSAFTVLSVSIVAALLPTWQAIRSKILDAIWG